MYDTTNTKHWSVPSQWLRIRYFKSIHCPLVLFCQQIPKVREFGCWHKEYYLKDSLIHTRDDDVWQQFSAWFTGVSKTSKVLSTCKMQILDYLFIVEIIRYLICAYSRQSIYFWASSSSTTFSKWRFCFLTFLNAMLPLWNPRRSTVDISHLHAA